MVDWEQTVWYTDDWEYGKAAYSVGIGRSGVLVGGSSCSLC